MEITYLQVGELCLLFLFVNRTWKVIQRLYSYDSNVLHLKCFYVNSFYLEIILDGRVGG